MFLQHKKYSGGAIVRFSDNSSLSWFSYSYLIHVILSSLSCVVYSLVVLELTRHSQCNDKQMTSSGIVSHHTSLLSSGIQRCARKRIINSFEDGIEEPIPRNHRSPSLGKPNTLKLMIDSYVQTSLFSLTCLIEPYLVTLLSKHATLGLTWSHSRKK